MKKVLLLVLSVVALMFATQTYAQKQPISFTHSQLLSEIDAVEIAAPDMNIVAIEDDNAEKNGQMYANSRILSVNINMQNSGTTDILEDGTLVWRLKIISQNAQALKAMFNYFYLPEGSCLFAYNENKRQVLKLTSDNNPKKSNYYSHKMVQGDVLYLEYIQPANVSGTAILDIDQLAYFYRSVDQFVGYYKQQRPTGFGNSQSCEVNINCTMGNNWQTQKKGVAEIYIVMGNGPMAQGGFCTGTLVNNTANDGTPYFLTADHCGGVDAAPYVERWEFYFNFEAAGCTNPNSAPDYDQVVGCTIKARPSGAQMSGTDFLLLELNTTEDELEQIGAYYNGWDRSTTGAAKSTAIHHPSGDIKKISFCNTQLVPMTYGQAQTQNGHWFTQWVHNGDTTGVTEQGSSGSPLFNSANKLVVGTLSGGSSDCNQTGQNRSDLYGRFDFHWENGGTANANRLKPWLDPANTDAQTCEGRFPNAGGNNPDPGTNPGTLNADFTANPTTVTAGGTVAFTDQSTGNPTSWSWTFQGGTPATSTSQNPSIDYATPGTYNVSLTISDGTSEDVETKNAYITVTDGGGETPTPPDPNADIEARFTASSYNIIIGQCINFTDFSQGAPNTWQWTFQGAETVSSQEQNPTNICYNVPGTYDVTLYVMNEAGDYDSEVCEDCITVANDPELPIADFEANITIIPVGGVVRFTNLSQNGPFNQWAWTFDGGTPATCSDSVPPVIAYTEVGTYDVELRCRKSNGVQDIETKVAYIKVVPSADERPRANFVSDRTLVRPGQTVNFTDISGGHPYRWAWSFEGADIPASTRPNPTATYTQPGTYRVSLRVENNIGFDEMIKEAYIIVSENDPCTEAPVAEFNCRNRSVGANTEVFFENLSQGVVSYSSWTFNGGSPSHSTDYSTITPVIYNVPGIYDVTLTVSNACGSSSLTKPNYIYVWNGPTNSYCDTLSNIQTGDVLGAKTPAGTWGYIAGQNGKKPKAYAEYFNDYTFSEVRTLLVPVNQAVQGAADSYVRFCVWSDSLGMPSQELANKKVYIRTLTAGQTNVISFDEAVHVQGPFYVGFKVNYPDDNNDNVSDDLFVVPIVTNRGFSGRNTMFVQKSGVWQSATDMFQFNTSLPIQPVSCLVDIEDVTVDESIIDVYPNPTNGMLNINLNAENENVSIEIYDILGKQISHRNYNGISMCSEDISNYAEGVYILKISTSNQTTIKKITLAK